MASRTVEGTEAEGYVNLSPDSESAALMDEIEAGWLGSPDQCEAELDLVLAQVRVFWKMEPDEVMQCISAFGARLAELYVLLHRVEKRDRTYRQIRTQQVQPLQDELKRQWDTASRMLEVRRQDLIMQGRAR